MTRVDAEGVPMLVQSWKIGPVATYIVTLVDGRITNLDMYEVLAHADLPTSTFSRSRETDAIDKYVTDFWHIIKGQR